MGSSNQSWNLQKNFTGLKKLLVTEEYIYVKNFINHKSIPAGVLQLLSTNVWGTDLGPNWNIT